MLEARTRLASRAIRRALARRAQPVTQAQIERQYALHKFLYLTEAERDIYIVHMESESEALQVKHELESGKSFAYEFKRLLAKKPFDLQVRQPYDSHQGFVTELKPHTYGEAQLNEAIFAATPGVLAGPVKTDIGYFLFDVAKILNEHETPLSQVRAAIRQELAGPLQEQSLEAFTKHWAAVWTAQTECSPGFVVPGCRQFKGPPVTSLEGPSSLD
jgi:foldase protein PrsA